jgi:hypothetical protein
MSQFKFNRVRPCATLALALMSFAGSGLAYAATLSIAGKPPTWLTATHSYNFQPTISGAGTRTVRFQIANKPVWLQFDALTGRLHGTPSNAYVGKKTGIVISVTAGTSKASLPSFAITVARSDLAPTIAGTPQNSVAVNVSYVFQPTARDQEGATLTFSIQGKPAWLTFSSTTGRLAGTPLAANGGTSSRMIISVSDGQHSTALPAFTLTVIKPAVVLSSLTLSWTAPTENVDGSALVNLAGFRLHYGTDPAHMDHELELPGKDLTSASIEELAAGTYYFAIVAYNTDSVVSELSGVVWKTIG